MFEDVTLLIREVVNHVLSLSSSSNFIAIFPRPDFKGLAYLPQVFFIFPKLGAIEENLSSISSQRAIINLNTRRSEFVSYNVTANPEIISISNAILSAIYDKILIENLKTTPFANSALEFDSNFIKMQFREKFKAGIYYTIYGPSIGFHETAIINSLKIKSTSFIDELDISLQIKIVKTFNFFTYKG
ncbi:DUF792 family protein [Borrelia hermsii]|uniref:Uncharacterized protein n=2 Tax=Borrelia hermsii TaxID=140 RepID=T1ECB3_BORHE|nr:DUF792 family protein [Borrelia hermsii]ADN26342.1 hypothetical protein BHA086 [Borrelia hermsii]AMR75918.1 hypothetical protein A0V01_04725 [Borrelia hermsii]ANA43727.1 hypothetical protein AXX13_A0415 [Borrelia hermsii HS1]UCP01951.1 DUF792 family protein [Borrelia hermsii]UPA08516.1 DUF792 family protein [Borrelia hermsii DAH]